MTPPPDSDHACDWKAYARHLEGRVRELEAREQQAQDRDRRRHQPGNKGEGRKPKDEPKPRQPRPGHGPTPQAALPVVEDAPAKLDQADQACPQCGGQLEEWAGQFEESEEIDVVVKQHVRRIRRRQKYKCCACAHIESPLAEPRVVPGGRYSNEFALQVVVEKFLDALPLERQVRRMARSGLVVTSQTLWDLEWALYTLLRPSQDRLKEHLLSQEVLGGDETRWPVLGKESKNWTMWCVGSPRAVLYEILDGRGAKQCEQLVLKDFTGTLVVDGYVVYEWLRKEYPSIELAHCWAHARRHLQALEQSNPEEVKAFLDLVDKLFEVERRAASRQQRAALRAEESARVVAEIRLLITTTPALPESGLRKAMEYMANRWTGLTLFLANPDVPLSNNATERAQRGPVLGRNAFYGSHSRRGTEAAALLYSLLESAKLCGINPEAYLRLALQAALAHDVIPLPHEVTDRPEVRLPTKP